MSDTPPPDTSQPLNGRDRTPELTSKRERRHREDEEDDRDRSGRSHRHEQDEDPERRRRHRYREDETEEERHERHERRRQREREGRPEETEEEREERRRRRKERELRDREYEERRVRGEYDDRRGSSERDRSHHRRDRSRDSRRDSHQRDRSRESHRSHRSRDIVEKIPAIKEMTREEKEAERERRDREMQEEKREAAKQRGARYEEMNRERERERRERYNSHDSPRRRRPSPSYNSPDRPPPPPREPPPPADPVTQFLNEVDSEARTIFVSQIAARLTSSDLGLFFEDKLGRGSVRDARVVTERQSRRSKGIGYVELDTVELVNQALALNGTVVMGIPIVITLTESERNREGQLAAMMNGTFVPSTGGRQNTNYQINYPPLSTGLAIPHDVDVDAHKHASVPYHRLFVLGLAINLSADDIRQVFEAFGEIEFVDLHRDFAGTSKGTAYVQFKELKSAQMALDAMNNFELAGRPIRVITVQVRQERAPVYVSDQIEDTGYGPRMDATQRQQLMFKLARTEPTTNTALSAHRPSLPSKSAPIDPTVFIVVANMFNSEDETERNWDLDLAEDVRGEVESKYGLVKRIKVDKMSSSGEVYIEFNNIGDARGAIKGLNGRFFGGRQLQASFISEALFKAHM
ncbi:hypothetical protein BCR39DRAFT_511177 [Naematelia encephala]|uniref:RRM domain-containing protein n=1 Tax=Naematelia encephala TaxID=71784 RepID=A0A1Y2BLI5_9TREE|nr:hypothetical protein BCR39DRAFT_511177 [Naematelia encephala]